jgi:hypothetical protein
MARPGYLAPVRSMCRHIRPFSSYNGNNLFACGGLCFPLPITFRSHSPPPRQYHIRITTVSVTSGLRSLFHRPTSYSPEGPYVRSLSALLTSPGQNSPIHAGGLMDESRWKLEGTAMHTPRINYQVPDIFNGILPKMTLMHRPSESPRTHQSVFAILVRK